VISIADSGSLSMLLDKDEYRHELLIMNELFIDDYRALQLQQSSPGLRAVIPGLRDKEPSPMGQSQRHVQSQRQMQTQFLTVDHFEFLRS
jgi:hypothetical protein